MLPATIAPWVEKYFGVITITAGWFISNRSRRKMVKSVGLGMIVGGVYDLIATNFADLPFIPKISPAAPPAEGWGASIGTGKGFSTVGANISAVQAPNIVGMDMDIDDVLENI